MTRKQQVQRDQACFCMIEGCIINPWYEQWFIITMKEWYKDPIDQEQWMKNLEDRKKEAQRAESREVK